MTTATGSLKDLTTPLCGEKKSVDIPERAHPLDPHTVAQLDRYQAGWEILT